MASDSITMMYEELLSQLQPRDADVLRMYAAKVRAEGRAEALEAIMKAGNELETEPSEAIAMLREAKRALAAKETKR